MKAPTLTKRDQRALARAERTGERAHWTRDERAFAFVVADTEARDHVRQVEYWSHWATAAEAEDSVRSREAVKSSRYWEDVQVRAAEEPTGYTLRHADGTEEWVPAPTTEAQTAAATEAAAEARQKGAAPMTPAERKALSRWRKRARAAGWSCPAHPAPDLVDCGTECRDQQIEEARNAHRANLENVNVHAH